MGAEVPQKIPGDTYTAIEYTAGTSQEVQNIARNAQLTLDPNNYNQSTTAIARLSISANYWTFLDTVSTENSYVLAKNDGLLNNNPLKYFNGMTVEFTLTNSNFVNTTEFIEITLLDSQNVPFEGSPVVVDAAGVEVGDIAEGLTHKFVLLGESGSYVFRYLKQAGVDIELRNQVNNQTLPVAAGAVINLNQSGNFVFSERTFGAQSITNISPPGQGFQLLSLALNKTQTESLVLSPRYTEATSGQPAETYITVQYQIPLATPTTDIFYIYSYQLGSSNIYADLNFLAV